MSSSSITFTTPAKTVGDYDVVVTNTNGLAATLQNGISYNGVPAFTTAHGNVGSILEDVAMSTITIVAAEPDGGTLASQLLLAHYQLVCLWVLQMDNLLEHQIQT